MAVFALSLDFIPMHIFRNTIANVLMDFRVSDVTTNRLRGTMEVDSKLMEFAFVGKQKILKELVSTVK
jgi:hypothetical protein